MKQSIKYSVGMRPNPMNAEEEPKAYGTIQLNATLSLEDMAEHIHDHNTVFSKGVILGVLVDMTHCVREALAEGNAVQLGELGEFRPTLTTEGASAGKDADGNDLTAQEMFSAGNIKKLNINFVNGSGMEFDVKKLDFEYVTTRKAQAAAKRAEKKGEKSADWTPTDSESSGPNTQPVRPNPDDTGGDDQNP